MRKLLGSGVWEIFLPGVGEGAHYKFEVKHARRHLLLKSDPFAFFGQQGKETVVARLRSRALPLERRRVDGGAPDEGLAPRAR